MQKLKPRLEKLLISLLLTSFIPTVGKTNDFANGSFNIPTLPAGVARVTCEEVLDKCGQAVEAKNKHIQKLELGLAKQTERVVDLSSQLEDKNSQLQAWYRNPFVVGALGLVAGAAVITFAK